MRTEEYEIKRLCNDTKQVMRDMGQSSAVAISGLLAERLYEMGWRQQDKMAAGNERGYNLGLVDGAKQFAEKLKKKAWKGAHRDPVTYKFIERDYTITESQLNELLREEMKKC